jgi:hypothetical protein
MNSNVQRACRLSVSVGVDDVLNELDFLQAVNDDGVAYFYQPSVVSNAIRCPHSF